MSIADHFEHVPDTGLVQDYDGESARRQLSASLVLVASALFVLVVVALAFNVQGWLNAGAPQPVNAAPPAYAGRL